jgi:Na+/proline symporter
LRAVFGFLAVYPVPEAPPPLIGAVGLAAVFSAEISAADAVLLMLTTSLSRDLQAVRAG